MNPKEHWQAIRMVLSDAHKFAFVHIPPRILRNHFEEVFAKLTEYWSFALIRDPFSRFSSSLHECFVQRDHQPQNLREPSEIACEVKEVIAHLAKQPNHIPITDPDLIHFSRQSDYVYLDDRQIVKDPRTVAELGDVLADVSKHLQEPVKLKESKNERTVYKSRTIQALQDAITRPIQRVLPRQIWKPAYAPIKSVFRATGLIQKDKNRIAELPNYRDIQAFISEFYARDIRLYEQLLAERKQRDQRSDS